MRWLKLTLLKPEQTGFAKIKTATVNSIPQRWSIERKQAEMPETDLVRLLNSIGKSTFVRYYRQFSDRSLSHEDLIELLPKDYTLKARRTRVSKARRILDEGLQRQALDLIAKSERVDEQTAHSARELLKEI